MQNPLIEFRASLATKKSDPFQSGIAKRERDRKDHDITLGKEALRILEQYLPKLFHPDPHPYASFQKIWKESVFPALCKKFTSASQLSKANNLLTHLINEGNKCKLWHLPVPNTIIRQKRERPFRSHKWFVGSNTLMEFEQNWLSNIEKNSDPQINLRDCLNSAVLHSGLNEQRHLSALSEALQSKCPLQKIEQLVWLDLTLVPDRDHKKRSFPFSTNSHNGEDSVLVTRFFPTAITLALINKYLKNRKYHSKKSLSLQELLRPAFKLHGLKELSIELFCKAGIGVAETKPEISIPEANVEYATKRNMAYSLPANMWQSLFKAPTPVIMDSKQLQITHPNALPSLNDTKQNSNKRTSKFGLLDDLKKLLREKDKGIKRTSAKAKNEWSSFFPSLDTMPINESILLGWVKHKLDKNNKLSSIRRYVNAVGAVWLSGTRDIELTAPKTDFEALYEGMLEIAVSQNDASYRAGRLDDLHQFAVVNFQLKPLSTPLSDNKNAISRVRAGFVSEPVFAQLIKSISQCKDMTEPEQLQLCIICIIAFRAGLRIGEILKLRLKDIEWSAQLWLFIRDNQYDNNKSNAARRKVPLITLCTEQEKDFIRRWLELCRFSKARKSNPQQLFCASPHNRYEMPDKFQVSNLIGQLLKQITGVPSLVFYSLRHSAFSRLQLIMHWDDMDKTCLPESLIRAVMPYSQAERVNIKNAIFGLHPQSRYWALAVAAGHNSPLVTFNNYLHFCDLILFCELQKNAMKLTKTMAINMSGLSVKTISLLMSMDKTIEAYQLLNPTITKLQNKAFCIEHKASERTRNKQSAVKLELPKPDKSRMFYILHEFLSEYQAGQSTDMLVWQHKLEKKETDRWIANAKLICELSTSKNHPRHNPGNRDYSLIPPFPNSHAEKQDIQRLLTHFRKMFKDNPESAKKQLAFLSRLILLRTHSSDSAILIRHWNHLQKLLSIVNCFPKSRWRIQIGYQHKSTLEQWKNACRGFPTNKHSLIEDKRNPNGQAKVYLSHLNEKQIASDNEYGKYSTNVLKLTVRLLSILMFSEVELAAIC